MDPEVLGRRGLAGPVWYTPAVAPGSRLAFSHRAAYANLEVVEDGEAEVANVDAGAPPQEWPSLPHGVLYGLTERDWRALVAAEGGYRVSTVRVVTYGGGGGAGGGAGTGDGPPPPGTALSAAAFTSSPWSTMKAGSLPPRAAYLATLAAGARARGLDGAYTAWLSALAPAAVVPGRGLPPPYFETPGRDAVVVGGLVLAMGMLGWGLVGGSGVL